MYSCGSLHVDEQRQDVQLEPMYNSSVPIRDVALRICRKQWTIGRCGERGSGISVLIAQHEGNDDDSLDKDIHKMTRFVPRSRPTGEEQEATTRVHGRVERQRKPYYMFRRDVVLPIDNLIKTWRETEIMQRIEWCLRARPVEVEKRSESRNNATLWSNLVPHPWR